MAVDRRRQLVVETRVKCGKKQRQIYKQQTHGGRQIGFLIQTQLNA